jgi:hypothetical protein
VRFPGDFEATRACKQLKQEVEEALGLNQEDRGRMPRALQPLSP